ncbi:hybrid sensor histidine kinase/response regulator transcription factor [Parabacteroides pacaensis]|uniref:hybrid sensor histidine kinase/response regulator transcription factor n=1 Tax=Parabacteroides pacaensis TaxID=2086575 RepID=UPI000D0E8573|nr:hybrid sensor histidine kinase/response regulator transcription factor [Parabacteroides pacaensis]
MEKMIVSLFFTILSILNIFGSEKLSVKFANVLKQDFVFKRFMARDGLPDERIRSIYQDQEGFLWVGTMNGLCKYDGYSIRKYYKTSDNKSISGNWIFAICEDSLQNLWIGTLEGLSCFDKKKETFTNYLHDPADVSSLSYNEIYTLLFDNYGKLWVGTPRGLSRFDTGTRQFRHFTEYPFNTAIGKIIKSYGDYIWVATYEGIARYNVITNKYKLYKIDAFPNPFGDKFWSMLEYNKDLYITTGGAGLIKLKYNPLIDDYEDFVYLNYFEDSEENLQNTQVFDICTSESGDFWLGTEKGLARIEHLGRPDAHLIVYKNNPENNRSISNNSVYKVFIDRTGVLWCGTEHGLNKSDLNLLPFSYYSLSGLQSKEQVRSIYSKDGETVWFGTESSGFFQYNIRTGKEQYYKFESDFPFFNATRSIIQDKENTIWLGTLGGALMINGTQYPNKICDHATFAFLNDSKGNHWIGTNDGLYKIGQDGARICYNHSQQMYHSTRSEFIRSLYEDNQGYIWCGFENNGLSRLNPVTGEFVQISEGDNKQKLFGSTVFSITEYPENVIWAGTEAALNKISCRIEEGKLSYTIKNYHEKDGLSDKSVSGILADQSGNLWISTIKGLMRFNVADETFEHFLTDFNFSVSCYCRAGNGNFLFGTEDGFVSFNPAYIRENNHIPRVVLTEFRLFNEPVAIDEKKHGDIILHQSIAETKEVTLNYKNNVFSIAFASLHFSNPERNRYAYMMQGFDAGWIQTDAGNRVASYTNLNPGSYVFMVKTANHSGKWSLEPVTLRINILPPPWKTWWAYTLYFILFCLLLYTFVYYFLKQERQRHEIELEKREKEQISLLNHQKLRFFTNIAHEFRTPLMLIVGPVEDLLSRKELPSREMSRIRMIYKNCMKLTSLINELMTFRKLEGEMLTLKAAESDIILFLRELTQNFTAISEKRKVIIRFETDLPECVLWFDPRVLEKVFNNLISNAFKFIGEEGQITIKATLSRPASLVFPPGVHPVDYICISVEDNGKGIPSEQLSKIFDRFYQVDSKTAGTGIGLSLAKSLIEMHNGLIQVESEPGKLTCFSVYLPLSDSYLTEEQRATGEARPAFTVHSDLPNLLDEEPVSLELEESGKKEDEDIIPEVLLVDDNEEVLEFLGALFHDKYRVKKALNGQEALAQIAISEPDLIISDVIMPVMDGIELCRQVKNNISTCHIPFILLTAKSSVEHVISGIEQGADDYITKPFNSELLKIRAFKLIESRKRLIEKFRSGADIDPQELSINPLDQEFVEKVLEVIMQHLDEETFGVEELSSLVYMSRTTLFRKLKAITGQTPIEFIYSTRLKQSRILLAERRLNISEVAYDVGFKNPSSFSKAFRKQFGISPTDFINSLKK